MRVLPQRGEVQFKSSTLFSLLSQHLDKEQLRFSTVVVGERGTKPKGLKLKGTQQGTFSECPWHCRAWFAWLMPLCWPAAWHSWRLSWRLSLNLLITPLFLTFTIWRQGIPPTHSSEENRQFCLCFTPCLRCHQNSACFAHFQIRSQASSSYCIHEWPYLGEIPFDKHSDVASVVIHLLVLVE